MPKPAFTTSDELAAVQCRWLAAEAVKILKQHDKPFNRSAVLRRLINGSASARLDQSTGAAEAESTLGDSGPAMKLCPQPIGQPSLFKPSCNTMGRSDRRMPNPRALGLPLRLGCVCGSIHRLTADGNRRHALNEQLFWGHPSPVGLSCHTPPGSPS
jgi:hypothetical protein